MPETQQLHKKLRAKTIGYLLTAFGVVAGLAWNDAISALIHRLFPLEEDSVLVKLLYAVIVTLLVVLVGTFLSSAEEKSDEKK
jgi:hypothetical protein